MNRISVASTFDSKGYLQQLTNDFAAVKVDSKSLKTTVWRRFVRNIEEALEVSTAIFGGDSDWEDYATYLAKILNEVGYETKDLTTTLIVIGNKNGILSERVFNQSNYERLITDLNQFETDYPIFIDTSAARILFSEDKPTEYVKRERLEDTFQTEIIPPAKKLNPETLEDLMAQWAEEREQFQEQIDMMKSRESKILEQNQALIEECGQREQDLLAAVKQCQEEKMKSASEIERFQDEIRQLKMEPMEYGLDGGEEEEEQPTPRAPIRDQTTTKRSVPTRSGARITSLFGSYFDPLINNDAEPSKTALGQPGRSLSLAKIGMQAWDPNSSSFLDYLETFEASLTGVEVTHAQAIVLLFSALPPKYSYLRSVANKHADFDIKDFESVANILRKLIVGGTEKVFAEFEKLQKKPNEAFLHFLEKCKNYYQWTMDDSSQIDTDATAYRMIKSKMVHAYPSRYVSEFKRRLEGKNTMSDIFMAILDMAENFPDIEDEGGNDGTDMMALRKSYDDWLKSAKCYSCGRKGHIKKNCWKRESKTPKSGRKGE